MTTEPWSSWEVTTYLALAEDLERHVRAAAPGERVASEHDLVAAHGISRLTARAALQELERRNLVRRVRGAGTFVARRIEYRIGADMAPSWSETVRSSGGVPHSEVLSSEVVSADPTVAEALALGHGASVVRIERRGWVDGEQANVGISYLPADRFGGLTDVFDATDAEGSRSLYTTLTEQYDTTMTRRWSDAELEVVTPEAATLLGLAGRPLAWWLRSANDDENGRPVELACSWLRADVYRVVFELGQHP